MHLLFIVNSLATLSAGALAIATPKVAPLEIGMGSIGAYKNKDCTGPPFEDITIDHRTCIDFTPATDFAGINWGENYQLGTAAKLRAWHTHNCTGPYVEISRNLIYDKQGTNLCALVSATGGPWNSVRFFGPNDKDRPDGNYANDPYPEGNIVEKGHQKKADPIDIDHPVHGHGPNKKPDKYHPGPGKAVVGYRRG